MSYPIVHLRDVSSQPRYMIHWESVKHTKIHLFTEMVAEMVPHSYDIFSQMQLTTWLRTDWRISIRLCGLAEFLHSEERILPNNWLTGVGSTAAFVVGALTSQPIGC